MRVAVINQRDEGGATAAAREIFAWGPARGIEARYFPDAATATADELAAALGEFEPDIVHAHVWYRDYPLTLLRDLGEHFPVVFTVHDVATVNQYGSECWECYHNPWCLGCPALGPLRRWRPNYRIIDRLRKRRINRRTRAELIYPSEWMGRRLARSEWSEKRSTVIPYSIDTDAFAPGPSTRAELRLPEGLVILFAGNMYSPNDHRKGLPDLLAAFGQLLVEDPDAHLLVAGRVALDQPPPGVTLLGEIDTPRLMAYYRAADLFCLPSRGDNLPLAVLEAMSSGLPIVATSVGGIPEAVENGRTGFIVPPADRHELRAALMTLARDAGLRKQMSARARTRALEIYTRERSADLHEALYRRLA